MTTGGTGAAPFTALTDPSDGASGRSCRDRPDLPVSTATGWSPPTVRNVGEATISIAVDSRNSSTV